jgi:hypothetical protein
VTVSVFDCFPSKPKKAQLTFRRVALLGGAVESIVVTGDNTMNGIRVAKEAGIITANKTVIIGNVPHDSDDIVWTDEAGKEVGMPSSAVLERNNIHLAMSGSAWLALRTNNPKVANHTAPFVRVFGRCTPFDKVSVVDTFVELGFITMMCGTSFRESSDRTVDLFCHFISHKMPPQFKCTNRRRWQ